MQTEYVYVLHCASNKFYVGKTTRPMQRLASHFNGQKTAFTAVYGPLEVIELLPAANEFSEDVTVKRYMKKYGIDNVRGGSYSTVELSDVQRTVLETELRSAGNECFNCGQTGHFARDCTARSLEQQSVTGSDTASASTSRGAAPDVLNALATFLGSLGSVIAGSNGASTCSRCGRTTHLRSQCYARWSSSGQRLED